MNRDEEIGKEIREYWFKDHKAEIEKHGDITILKWRNPNSSSYYVRYVFDGSRMYITGDIGEAVFNLTWKAEVHSFHDVYLRYFLEKMSTCSNGKYEFDSDTAKEKLIEWKAKVLEDKGFENQDDKEEFLETFDEMIEDANCCDGEQQWAWEYVNEKYSDFISEIDADYWEWIYEIGRVIPYHNYAYLIGLKMASEQLRKEGK